MAASGWQVKQIDDGSLGAIAAGVEELGCAAKVVDCWGPCGEGIGASLDQANATWEDADFIKGLFPEFYTAPIRGWSRTHSDDLPSE